MKTVLIEKTSKKLKLYELIITALLFITLLTGFGALYIAVPLAIAVWSVTGHLSASALLSGGITGKIVQIVKLLIVNLPFNDILHWKV